MDRPPVSFIAPSGHPAHDAHVLPGFKGSNRRTRWLGMSVEGISGVDRPTPQLSEFLRRYQQDIISDWLPRMRTVPPARNLSESALIDPPPAILTRIPASIPAIRDGGPV